MGGIQSYYAADLFNIEEILSILEMRDQIGGKRSRRFVRLILDVISYYTPPPPEADPPRYSANWYEYPIQQHSEWSPYFYFAMSLLNIRIEQDLSDANRRFVALRDEAAPARYSVVTLNYDMVLETWSQFLTRYFVGGGNFRFSSDAQSTPRPDEVHVPLAKLHGGVDTDHLIAPTWNKGISKTMSSVWQSAHDLLRTANQIRIIGYSLPVADAYIKYLLKSAVIDAPNLKSIDVICQDHNGTTHPRYKEFINFGYARFANADVRVYLAHLRQETIKGCSVTDKTVRFNKLESAHKLFFDDHGRSM
jgi:hypothetical protein